MFRDEKEEFGGGAFTPEDKKAGEAVPSEEGEEAREKQIALEKISFIQDMAQRQIENHRKSLVFKIEQLLKQYGIYEKFPEGVAEKIANEYAFGNIELVKEIAAQLLEENIDI